MSPAVGCPRIPRIIRLPARRCTDLLQPHRRSESNQRPNPAMGGMYIGRRICKQHRYLTTLRSLRPPRRDRSRRPRDSRPRSPRHDPPLQRNPPRSSEHDLQRRARFLRWSRQVGRLLRSVPYGRELGYNCRCRSHGYIPH